VGGGGGDASATEILEIFTSREGDWKPKGVNQHQSTKKGPNELKIVYYGQGKGGNNS